MIREYVQEDIDQIIEIWHRSSTVAHPFLDSGFVSKVRNDMRQLYIPNSKTWVYESGNSIVAFISMHDNEIGGLFVLPQYQSKGIGSELVDFVIKGHPVIEVEVFERNVMGRAFYEKYGFKLVKSYYHLNSRNEVLRLALKS